MTGKPVPHSDQSLRDRVHGHKSTSGNTEPCMDVAETIQSSRYGEHFLEVVLSDIMMPGV